METNTHGQVMATINSNSNGGFLCIRAECATGEARLRARNSEHRRKEDGCRVVTYPLGANPLGAKSLPHHHAKSVFIYAYVLSGAVRSQVDDDPTRITG